MNGGKRPIIGVRKDELVPPDEDRPVEVGTYDALLPCRQFKVDYKVAVLGSVTPSLEFMLRLVKAAPGIVEEDAAAFFGYNQGEFDYVMREACDPGYMSRRDGCLWLTLAGEGLFIDGESGPLIFAVEGRSASFGFDLFSVAPQRRLSLDEVERVLPELPVEPGTQIGGVSERIPERVLRFFYELSDRRDREQSQRRDLYSVDTVTAEERFQVPVRIRAFARASSPSLAESDLRSWRPDQDLADRPQVERAAAVMLQGLRVSRDPIHDPLAYGTLLGFAPDFLKEFTTRDGLAVIRYWREAVGRAGEVRVDRPTIPIVGPWSTNTNIERLGEVVDYGLRGHSKIGLSILSVAPQVSNWGGTTQLREALGLLRGKLRNAASSTEGSGIALRCLLAGKESRYVAAAFDSLHAIDPGAVPAKLEILLVPGVAAAAVVHAPIGVIQGHPVPLGFASFDAEVVWRIGDFVRQKAFARLSLAEADALEATLQGIPTEADDFVSDI